jgi:hypothetical protein
MNKNRLSRRSLLKGAAAAAVLPAFSRGMLGATAPTHETSALVILYLNGGPSGLFNSANSFLPSGSFGVTGDNVRAIGNGVFVDAGTLGSLPPAALTNMASINFKHGIQRHELARGALLQTGSRSNLLLLAQAMSAGRGGRCVVVNTLGLPVGVDPTPPAESGIGLERVLDLKSLNAIAGIAESSISRDQITAAYGLNAKETSICDLKTTLVATELLLRSGSNVIFAQPAYLGRPDRQFDTHGDTSGVQARQIMSSILPELQTFMSRSLGLKGRNVVVALFGEFSRTVDASDHEPGGTATVIGKYVKTGTAGPQNPDGSPPLNSPPVAGLWSYLASVLRVEEHPFGRNPNPELVA